MKEGKAPFGLQLMLYLRQLWRPVPRPGREVLPWGVSSLIRWSRNLPHWSHRRRGIHLAWSDMSEQIPWPSEKLRRNWGGQRGTDVPCAVRARREKMSCCDVRGNVRGRKSTCTKVSAAAPERRSATRSGYHRGRREAHQKNWSDADGKLRHNAQL